MTAAKCPICGKAMQATYRPFCSTRCANVDLQRWFKGSYAIPAIEDGLRPKEEDDEE